MSRLPPLDDCKHARISFEPSNHAETVGFHRPQKQQRATAAGLRKGQFIDETSFPGPLVVPGDDLAVDPRWRAQSLRSWKGEKDRNAVTPGRKTIYVAGPPAISDEMRHMRSWDVPTGVKTGNQSELHTVPDTREVAEYLSVFYHGMPVKMLQPHQSPLRYTVWEDSLESHHGQRSAPKHKAVALETSTEAVRIRCRPCPDGGFPYQLNLNDLLDVVISILPLDAYCLLLLVGQDLYEDEDDDFCCGRAYGGSRCAVVSYARYNPTLLESQITRLDVMHPWPASHCMAYVESLAKSGQRWEGQTKYSRKGDHKGKKKTKPEVIDLTSSPPTSPATVVQETKSACHAAIHAYTANAESVSSWLASICRTASHELGHCLGLDHCVYYACAMQGTASVAEDLRQPLYLCPIDLEKLGASLGSERYQFVPELTLIATSPAFDSSIGGASDLALAMGELLPTDNRGEAVTALKGRKSLTRSLSAAFRKSSRSRAPPPDLVPQIPAELRPTTAPTSPRTITAKFHHATDDKDDQKSVSEGAIGLGTAKAFDDGHHPQVKKKKSIRHLSLRHAKQNSWAKGDDAQRPRTASAGHQNPLPMQVKTDKPQLKQPKPKKSLHLSTGNPSTKEAPNAATVASSVKSISASPQLSRPGTSDSGPLSPRLAGTVRSRANSSPRNGLSKVMPEPFNLPASTPRPWQASYSPKEVRSSFRSALTTATSRTTGTGTSRSSVVTKDTALTDATTDGPAELSYKDDSEGVMTVDEAIDMYVAGFTDDVEEEPQESRDTSLSDEERRRSMKIAEAFQDNMGSPMSDRPSFSTRPSTSGSSRSRFFRSNSAIQSSPASPLDQKSLRDQYGFFKSNHYISRAAYDAWYAGYASPQAHRLEKWTEYMKEHKLSTTNPTKFPPRSAKAQRYVRKGVPPAFRGAAWFYYAGGDTYLSRHPQLYNNLVHLSDARLPESEKEAIERDLHRTFPDNVGFKPDPAASPTCDTPLLASLRRVLQAFALHNPKIGYCQSLNFVAGLLLLFLPEEKSFWMLHIIAVLYLPATHEVSLEGANVDLWVLAVALRNTMPSVWTKVGGADLTGEEGRMSRLPPISLCATSWFMSLFIGTLPIETVLRVWDVLFYEGSRTLFRVALNIFKIGEQKIKSVNDPMEMFQIVQSLPRGMIDAGKFMDLICRRGQVGADWVERMRGERRMWLAKQRAKNPDPITEKFPDEEIVEGSGLRRKKSVLANLRRQGIL
ncbi:uncharacterized protein KY384_000595 [Bacidia gigantensis]|uniref:uncharacterized protein n=1 Tax=Bacidia gigantensis TaxID=2732470 RepID=UPI001D0590CF|nr:uncharacterized protein KY384_000595 [Bacidia gigantensis]KAG8525835.1 hypothetical protein KY384_000595 [Bacidia gigantensis]